MLRPQDGGILDLTDAPYVVDFDLEYNEARIIDDKLHVGSAFHEMLLAATEAKADPNKVAADRR